ncbi:unnamed protein product [Natator depressus]
MAGQDKLAGYCRMLQDALSDAWAKVKDAQPLPLDTCAHSLFPGNFVCARIHRRKHCLEPRWSAPAQVLLTTPTAVKIEGIDRWVRCSHCKKVPAPRSPRTAITTAAPTRTVYRSVSGIRSSYRILGHWLHCYNLYCLVFCL